MSASFLSPSSTAKYDRTIFGHTNSPLSLTTDSSPASSDSTGDDNHGKARKRQQGSPRQAAPSSAKGVAGLLAKGGFASTAGPPINQSFSPSIWNEETRNFMGSFEAGSSVPTFPGDKESFDAMNFGGWDSSFGSSLHMSQDGGDMSMVIESAAGTDSAFSPLSAQSPGTVASIQHRASLNSSAMGASGLVASPSGSDVKAGTHAAIHSQPGSSFGSGEDSDGNAWLGKTSDNDETMFNSLIQAESFAPPSARKSKNGVPNAPPTARFQAMNIPANGHNQAVNGLANGNHATSSKASNAPSGSRPSKANGASASSSRRNSGDKSDAKKESVMSAPNASSTPSRRHSSQTAVNSNNLDADLGYSAFDIVRPAHEELKELQVHVHGVPMRGAKSRVETQIHMRLELVRPRMPQYADGSRSDQAWERIGSFTHIKLPPLSGTKRKSKKYQRSDIPTEKTLFVDATVVNATPPHDIVFVCKGCCQRERKRAHRKKDPKAPVDLEPTQEEMKSLGINPSEPDAMEKAQARMEEEEKKHVVLFNCGDYVDFEDGEAVLPTRITCYCRHHREKVGFCVIFTMRDWQGRLVATGSTPPIMITDDHKSMGIAAQAATAAAQQPQQAQSQHVNHGIVKQVNGTSPRGNGAEADEHHSVPQGTVSGATTPNGDGHRRKERAKPYSDSSSRRRRNTSGKDLSMTPYSGTGTNTPAVGVSPPASSNAGSGEFWNAFALAGTMAGLGRSNSTSTTGAKTPGEASSKSTSPASSTMFPPQNVAQIQQQMPQLLQAQLDQGSLSPNTLQTNLQSMPRFDFEQFMRNAQMGMTNGTDFAHLMAIAAAAAIPGSSRAIPTMPPLLTLSGMQPNGNIAVNRQQLPRISKLIPGEGPTSGGIEVTVLGENFVEGITCVFGDVMASNTKVWASNTLVCVLPPSPSPGPVVVSLKGPPEIVGVRGSSDSNLLQLFTYIDTTDRALMELALQVVGLQMTGQMRSAREVAMRVVGSGQQPGMGAFRGGGDHSGDQGTNHAQSREAITGLFTAGLGGRNGSSSFQDSVMNFLSLLDVEINEDDLPEGTSPRRDAIRLANQQGHTLLHLSVMMGFHRLVETLIVRGCPINARDNNGATALHFAALLGRVTITRLLLRQGARDDVADVNGLLPIDLAREKDQVDVEVVLAHTARTGHWQPQGVAFHHDSGISISDDGLDSDEDSDEDSDDEDDAELDDDNFRTSCDGESDYSVSGTNDSTEELSEWEDADVARDQAEAEAAVSALPQIEFDEKAAQKATDEKRAEAELEQHLPAIKSWLLRAGDSVGGVDWVNKNLLPRPVADRFAQLHMPAIPVFHLALPAAPSIPFMPWSSKSSEGEADADSKGKHSDWEQEERGRLLSLWRSVLEESAMWINPLYSPPPSYESVTPGNSEMKGKLGEQDKTVPSSSISNDTPVSRFPAIAEPSHASHEQDETQAPHQDVVRRPSQSWRTNALSQDGQHMIYGSSSGSSTPRVSRPARPSISSGSATPIGRPRSAAGQRGNHNRSANASSNSLAGTSSSTSAAQRRKRTLRDDAMLLWFWIPVLLVVVLVLLFSNSSSILSLADLMSYLDLPLDYYRPRSAAAIPEVVDAAL